MQGTERVTSREEERAWMWLERDGMPAMQAWRSHCSELPVWKVDLVSFAAYTFVYSSGGLSALVQMGLVL